MVNQGNCWNYRCFYLFIFCLYFFLAIRNTQEGIRVGIGVKVEVKVGQFPRRQSSINATRSEVVGKINIVVKVGVDRHRLRNIKKRNIIINRVQKKLIIITIPNIKMFWFNF